MTLIYSAHKPDPRAPINPRTGMQEGEIPCTPSMPLFYVTYGVGTTMAGKYSIVQAKDYTAARGIVDQAIGPKFAFMYDQEGFAGQAELGYEVHYYGQFIHFNPSKRLGQPAWAAQVFAT